MQFDDKVPIYYQIKTMFYHQIIAGKLAPGAKLPAVRQVAVDLTVNVNTAQRALSEMVTEGILDAKRGRGNFVTEDVAKIAALKHRLIVQDVAALYTQLHALRLDDAAVVQAVQTYIESKGETS